MKTTHNALVIAILLAGSVAQAQQLIGTVSPNPAPVGTPVTLSVHARTAGISTPNSCLIASIRAESPKGPTVGVFGCTYLPRSINVAGSGLSPRTQTWTQVGPAGQVAAGSYWLEVVYTDPQSGANVSEFFELKIDDAVYGPALTGAASTPTGSVYFMQISAPARAGDLYVTAISGSSNTGFAAYPGLFIGLDIDDLLWLSLDLAYAGTFQAFQGQLGSLGDASLAIVVPELPGIGWVPLRAQAVIAPLATAEPMQATNVLSFSLR